MFKVEKVVEPQLSSNARSIYYYVNENGCYICTSHRKDRDGYFKLARGGKEWLLHRYIYFLKHGNIPDGIVIMHLCDEPSCDNIKHLKAGTQEENMKQKVEKERYGKLRKSLTIDELQFIKDHQEMTIPGLALILNVSHKTIITAKKKMGLKKNLSRTESKSSLHNDSGKSKEVSTRHINSITSSITINSLRSTI